MSGDKLLGLALMSCNDHQTIVSKLLSDQLGCIEL